MRAYPGSISYVDRMTKEQVKAVLDRVLDWPPERQNELTEVALEIEAELSAPPITQHQTNYKRSTRQSEAASPINNRSRRRSAPSAPAERGGPRVARGRGLFARGAPTPAIYHTQAVQKRGQLRECPLEESALFPEAADAIVQMAPEMFRDPCPLHRATRGPPCPAEQGRKAVAPKVCRPHLRQLEPSEWILRNRGKKSPP
jgi:hypothetical protein